MQTYMDSRSSFKDSPASSKNNIAPLRNSHKPDMEDTKGAYFNPDLIDHAKHFKFHGRSSLQI